jgi:hypothetical protein
MVIFFRVANGDLYNLKKKKKPYKFKAHNTIKKNIGSSSANEVEDLKTGLIKIPENIPLIAFQPQDLQPAFQPRPVRTETRQPVHTETSFIEAPNPINKLIDAPEDELKALGFTDNALREMRALLQAGDNSAALKLENDLLVEILEKRVADQEKQMMEGTEENIDLRHAQVTEKAELEEKLKLEKRKVFNVR